MVLSLIFTGLIVHGGQKAYREAARTADVLVAARDIPVGTQIEDSDLELVSVPEVVADKWLADKNRVVGKIARVTILKGSYISEHALREGAERKPGHVGVMVAIDLASSAGVEAGDLVDIHVLDKRDRETRTAPALARNIRVLRVVTPSGEDRPISPEEEGIVGGAGGEEKAAAVFLEIPQDLAEPVVFYAAQKSIYLVQSAVPVEQPPANPPAEIDS